MQYSNDRAAPGQEPEPEYEGLDFTQYKDWWREAVDGYADPRKQSIRDEEYYDGDVKGTGWGHWTENQLNKLNIRNQPPVTRNIVCRKVNAICGVEQRARSEPRALPRTPKDQKSAEIATDALRYIKEQTRWLNTKSEKILEAVKVGFAAVEIGGAEDRVPITPIAWKDFFFDPRSRNFDFSDARYLGVAKWLDVDVAMATYAGPEIPQPQIQPKPPTNDPAVLMQWAQQTQLAIAQWQKEVQRRQAIIDTIESTAAGGGSQLGSNTNAEDEFDDRPSQVFHDTKRRRVFIIDMWHLDPKKGWFRCVFTGVGKLFTEPAKYIEKDEWGRARKVHPIKAFSLHVSKDLWRYGEVRGMRSTQDEVNFRLSKKLHYLATNQLFYKRGTFGEMDVDAVRREINRPDGVLEVLDPMDVKVEKNLDVAMALDVAMQEAMRFLDAEGANLELQGKQSGAASGRAILARQQAGLGQLGPLFDRIHDWELRCYRAMWARVQQFWTAPMYVRVTDDKNAARFAAVNGARVVNTDNGNRPPEAGAMPAMLPQTPQGGPMMGGAQAPMHRMPDGSTMPGAMHGQLQGGPRLSPGVMMQPGGSDTMGQGAPTPEEVGPMLAELDMDIIIDRAPEAATLQAEQYEALVQLAQSGVLGPPNPETARFLVTASSLPNKSELLDMLDKAAARPQGPSPQEKAMLEKLAAEIEKIISERDKNRAQTAKTVAEIPKTQAETVLTGAEARTETVNATMNEIGATNALRMGAAFNFAPPAAAGPSGASGLPPSEANGPPPY